MSDGVPLLELKDVTKRYGPQQDAGQDDVLRGVNLTVEAGESLTITGPSGSGKSTLLNIIGTLDVPSGGSILFDGENLSVLDETQRSALRNHDIGFIFQAHHLLPQCTALENVLVPTLVDREPARRRGADGRARQLLDRVGLAAMMHRQPGQLSGGEQQRVAVVRALINEPRLVLADEPTGSLDQESADRLVELLVALNREQRVTLIVVTHAPHVAGHLNRRLRMRSGVVEADGDAS